MKKIDANRHDVKRIVAYLQSMQRQPTAMHFLAPVDPKKHGCPDYFDVVETPMDLGTLSTLTLTPQEFADNVLLMFGNCCKYNPPTHQIYHDCIDLANWFKSTFMAEFPSVVLDFDRFGIVLEKQKPKPVKRRLLPYPRPRPPALYSPQSSKSNALPKQKNRPANPQSQLYSQSQLNSHVYSQNQILPQSKMYQTHPHMQIQAHLNPHMNPQMYSHSAHSQSLLYSHSSQMHPQTHPSFHPNSAPTTSQMNSYARTHNQAGLNMESVNYRNFGISQTPIGYHEKKHLASVLSAGVLPAHHLSHVIRLIRNSMPGLEDSREIELDIDKMDQGLVLEIYNYVTTVSK